MLEPSVLPVKFGNYASESVPVSSYQRTRKNTGKKYLEKVLANGFFQIFPLCFKYLCSVSVVLRTELLQNLPSSSRSNVLRRWITQLLGLTFTTQRRTAKLFPRCSVLTSKTSTFKKKNLKLIRNEAQWLGITEAFGCGQGLVGDRSWHAISYRV